MDVTYVLAAFEEINKCKLRVLVHIAGTSSRPILFVEVTAWDTLEDIPEARLLGSHKCQIGSNGPRTMEGAILSSLYGLDAIMAADEFARVNNK